jgi:hypothetical protein
LIKSINRGIYEYYRNKLTKKQKKSEQFSKQYWKKVRELDITLSYEENKNIFDENLYKDNNDFSRNRYYETYKSRMDDIKNAYAYVNILKKSNYLIFKHNFIETDKLLIMENDFEMYLENIELKNEDFIKYKNKDKIIGLHLDNCYFNLYENSTLRKYFPNIFNEIGNMNLQNLIEDYIISNLINLKHLEIKNLKIKINTSHSRQYNYRYEDIIYSSSIKFKDVDYNIDYRLEYRDTSPYD